MTVIEHVPPGLALILGAVALSILRGRGREPLVLLLPLFELWRIWQVPDGVSLSAAFLDFNLEIVRGDRLSRLFATIFAIMSLTGALFAMRQARTIELVAALAYAGSAIGVCFAGDLITLFIFWELMALGSTMVIWSARTDASYQASMRYLAIHLLGGMLFMAGAAAYVAETGSIAFVSMAIPFEAGSVGTWLILAGFLVNAGAPPLSAWLPDAYPEASPSGMVFLSAFTTKAAVYVLLRGFPGTELLIWVGLYMIFYGIIYALLENDMRRILAYSIVNQVGFMVAGVGIGTEMALNGAAAHAFTHIIYKALLLMSAGSVLFMTGKRKCSDLGGLFQSMPLTTICGIVGALAISSFPLTSGFVSKSMISEAAIHEHLALVWYLLAAASAGVFLHAGIKFPWFVFFQTDSGLRPPDPPWNMRAAMVFFAFLCIFLGVWTRPLYSLLPFPVTYEPYTGYHVLEMLQLLLFAGLAFFVMLPQMKRTLTITLDVDWFWRRFGSMLSREFSAHGARAHGHMTEQVARWFEGFTRTIHRHHGPQGALARTWPTGSTVLWIAVLLGVYLVAYYA